MDVLFVFYDILTTIAGYKKSHISVALCIDLSSLLAYHCSYHLSVSPVITKLTKVNTLPHSQI